MKANRGTNLEAMLTSIFAAYERQGEAVLEKVDPPTKTFGKGRIIHLANPFLDYVGTWTRKGGVTIIVEAKHTEKPSLAVKQHGGITEHQFATATRWRAAGAIVLFVWRYGTAAPRIVTPELCLAALRETGRKSLRWADAIPVQPGRGMVTYDILAKAAEIYRLPTTAANATNKAP